MKARSPEDTVVSKHFEKIAKTAYAKTRALEVCKSSAPQKLQAWKDLSDEMTNE